MSRRRSRGRSRRSEGARTAKRTLGGVAVAAVSLVMSVLPQGVSSDPAGALAARQESHGWGSHFWAESLPVQVQGDYEPLVGDFGGTSQDDIFWYASGPSTDHLWLSNNDGTFADVAFSPQVMGTYSPVVGDFGGSERDDILWYAPGGGADYLWVNSGDGSFDSTPTAINGSYEPAVLEDGEGKDDIVWVVPGGGSTTVWSFAPDGSHSTTPIDPPAGATPLVGRYNAGSCADIFWYAPGPSSDALWFMDCDGSPYSVSDQTVNGSYSPIVERLGADEDGLSDILWYRPVGSSFVWKSHGDHTWTNTSHTIDSEGTLVSTHRAAYLYVQDEPDRIFWMNASPDPAHFSYAGNEIGTGYTPVSGTFVGKTADVFWYQPGPAEERLHYLPS